MVKKLSLKVRPERFVEDGIKWLRITDSQGRVLSDFGEDRVHPPVEPGKKKKKKSDQPRGKRPT